MNKNELVSKIASDNGISESMALNFLDTLNSTILNGLMNGEKTTIVGFGTFSSDNRKEVSGKNITTLETINVPSIAVAKFKGGKEMLSKVPIEK